jgi:hypothetical protein
MPELLAASKTVFPATEQSCVSKGPVVLALHRVIRRIRVKNPFAKKAEVWDIPAFPPSSWTMEPLARCLALARSTCRALKVHASANRKTPFAPSMRAAPYFKKNTNICIFFYTPTCVMLHYRNWKRSAISRHKRYEETVAANCTRV